jgi:ATP-dependent Lhr-like helicase
MPLQAFHPAVAAWFGQAFAAPTPAQVAAWEAIRSGRHALVAAPTGSGKTLAAFLHAIDELVRAGLEGGLADETAVVYVSPLKALSNDVHINLELPIAGIRAQLAARGLPDVEIRSMVRTGDTPQAERTSMRKRAPHIVVTTPESLYVLLGSESGRQMLSSVRSVIVDEIHAIAPNKRGAHLALSLERLREVCGGRLLRIGLSATQKPIDEVARFLVGAANVAPDGRPDCAIVDTGHVRARDLALELPKSPLAPVMSNESWEQVYDRLAQLAREHRTTLVFVNTRRLAERVARHLSERLGAGVVAAHHGSMARDRRLDAEQKLKRGELRVLVATASLELGIDIGDVELVCQIASPRAISAFLQRVGRAGHAVGGTSKGRLFPLSRDDLAECAALLDAVRRGELDTLKVLPAPVDVLAQQIVAEVGAQDWNEDALFDAMRRAWPYRGLTREQFAEVARMLATSFTTRRGSRGAWLHRDAVNGELRARRGARMTALTSGGAIPDTADYQVVLEPQAQNIGTVHEDFAVESMAGDIFQLGNASYRVLRVEAGKIRVEDAQGLPPSIPFWLGEAPGRSDALSFAVSRLREELSPQLERGPQAGRAWLVERLGLDEEAARQLADYLCTARAALGVLPTFEDLAMERFFDESGGTQLVIHTPYGSRINRAWGLALRKRFCRSFNFELQAAATEDAIVLSLSTSHSFPLEDVARFLHSNTVEEVLTQALLDAPMFGVRWRWNATTALALPRFSGGSKVAPQLQRMRSEDLLASVFPDQVACQENLVGEREIPDHPLVAQTLYDCLYDAMDLEGLTRLLRGLESGAVRMTARDLASPSPLAAEVLNAKPYAFLDDAPLEERRTQAVMNRRWVDPKDASDFGQLDAEAIAAVREEAWPQARDADELADALNSAGFFTPAEVARSEGWEALMAQLAAAGRAARSSQPEAWIATERLPQLRAVVPSLALANAVQVPAEFAATAWTPEAALLELVRGRLGVLGPTTTRGLAAPLGVEIGDVELAMLALEREGFAMRGHFDADAAGEQWCERHLLARIHRYTVHRLRREIEPVQPRDLMRFLFQWQHVAPEAQLSGPASLATLLEQFEGYEAAAAAWESEILPARINGYDSAWLDELCLAGRVVWTRLRRGSTSREHAAGPVRATPIVLLPRRQLPLWRALAGSGGEVSLSSRAKKVQEVLQQRGASFFDELQEASHLLRPELEDALSELVAVGLLNSDSFAGLRGLLTPSSKRDAQARRLRRPVLFTTLDSAGRWSLLAASAAAAAPTSAFAGQRAPAPVQGELVEPFASRPEFDRLTQNGRGVGGVAVVAASGGGASARAPERSEEAVEHVARILLRRYGVVCWRLLEREAAWLPPWRDLLRVYRRLEARGEIRGGRFVQGLAGEHFALPEAVASLRKLRNAPHAGIDVVVSGADPLNLLGGVIAGERLPALTGARVLYRDGVPLATLVGGEVHLREPLDAAQAWAVRTAIARDTRQASRQRAVGA